MNSLSNRLNAIFAFGTMVFFILLFANVLTVLILPVDPQVKIKLHKLQSGVSQAGNDIGSVAFNLDADLSSLFHWNTKMLFVWITASYSTPDRPVNEVILWDDIIQTKDKSVIHLEKEIAEYALVDQSNGLK
eukprot:TRINITY_DN7478_c0_g1_i3.p1 TRINITY_DN7478_c0_g1~~TRINITY_DN7478_c0_g1_i3.p1  ORF type:complete len:132 (-),score=50.92 TRINITY_DN7478_c0_g1_i3:193-588(-)